MQGLWLGRSRFCAYGRMISRTIPEGVLNTVNRTLVLVSALGAGLSTVAMAQSAPAAAPAAAAAAAPAANNTPPPPPEAFPAKIALISFEQAVFATNEGQKAVQDVQKKWEPKRSQIE